MLANLSPNFFLLHIYQGGKTDKHVEDKTFQLELRAIRNLIDTVEEFSHGIECSSTTTCKQHQANDAQ